MQDPRRANYGRANMGQMAPYRDVPEDDETARQNTMAQAIAPQGPAPQGPQAAAMPDPAQQQRAQLQAPSGRQPASQPASGSLASFTGGGASRPMPGSLSDLTGGNTGITGGQGGRSLLQAPIPNDFPQGLPRLQEDGSYSAPSPGGLQLQSSASAATPGRQSDPSWFTGGWNQQKLDSGHDSPKYRVRRALEAAGFDPRQGITPEVEAALDGLGYGDGDVTGGDTYRFNSQDPEFNGMYEFDLVRGLDSGNGQWNFEPVQGQGAGMDPMQQALGAARPEDEQYARAMGIDTSNPLWRQIFEQLQAESLGGQGNLSGDQYYNGQRF
jgi:hypothetical protein